MAEQNKSAPGAPADVESVEAEKASSKGKVFLPLMVVLALACTALGGWIGYTFYPQLSIVAESINVAFGTNADEEGEEPIEYGLFTEVTGIVVNPSDSEGRRYLLANVGLESSEAGVIEELEEKDIVLRDTIIKLLSQRSVAELADINRRPAVKDELREAVNGILREGEIDRLYFTQYVLQ